MRSGYKAVLVILLMFFLGSISQAKPKLKLAADGFPTGQDTPEGAASDMARAFIKQDASAFRRICIQPYGAGQARAEYVEYLQGVSKRLKPESVVSADNPIRIAKVFAARHLSKNGPASYAYSNFNFQDIMFVDVEVVLRSREKHLRRTMVIKDKDGKWYVHPVPDVSPLLSAGLYDETASVELFTGVYDLEY
jgi:hypothetical protein